MTSDATTHVDVQVFHIHGTGVVDNKLGKQNKQAYEFVNDPHVNGEHVPVVGVVADGVHMHENLPSKHVLYFVA